MAADPTISGFKESLLSMFLIFQNLKLGAVEQMFNGGWEGNRANLAYDCEPLRESASRISSDSVPHVGAFMSLELLSVSDYYLSGG